MRDGFKETLLHMYSYTGTHVDPPARIFKNHTTLDQFPPEQFIGKALVIDCKTLKEGQSITMDLIDSYKAKQAYFLLFNLGCNKRWNQAFYFNAYPCIDEEVLDFILNQKFKGIGFDVIGLDPISDANLTIHKALFKNHDILNIENLKNLHLCGNDLFWFSCFPLKIKNSNSAPIRAIAWYKSRPVNHWPFKFFFSLYSRLSASINQSLHLCISL